MYFLLMFSADEEVPQQIYNIFRGWYFVFRRENKALDAFIDPFPH